MTSIIRVMIIIIDFLSPHLMRQTFVIEIRDERKLFNVFVSVSSDSKRMVKCKPQVLRQ